MAHCAQHWTPRPRLNVCVEAHLDACEDLTDKAVGVTIRGRIVSGPYQDRSFIGTYDPASHTGSLNLSISP
jgi:hypothetical protein